MKVYYSPDHQQHDPAFEGYDADGNMPSYEKAARAEIVRATLQTKPWAEFRAPLDFGLEPIIAIHGTGYLEYLRSAYDTWQVHSPVGGMAFVPGTFGIDYQTAQLMSEREQAGFFLLDTTIAIVPGTFKAALLAVYGALAGARAVAAGDQVAFALSRPPGHHAGREIAGGYCYFNNAAIAAHWLSQHGKVAVLDVDYHAGNGTEDIFYNRPDVLTVSLHADPIFEYPYYAGYPHETGTGPGTGFHRNYPLPAGTEQAQYLETLAQALALIDRFKPKHLVVCAGMDIYKDDPVGSFKLTHESIHRIGSEISQLKLPTLITMEGGYHLPSLGENFVAFLEPFA